MSESIWAQMIGQERPLAMLSRAAELGRVAQAYLFCGPAGVGKTMAARGLAQRLNCTGSRPPCGVCENCRRAAAGDPAHFMVIEPSKEKGGSLYRRQFHPIESMRALVKNLALRSFGDQNRVVVIRLAEFMREESATTFLKTLEEPPPRVILVLTSEQPARLLSTVVSRTVRLDFTPLPARLISDWLVTRHAVQEDVAQVLARSSAGRPARALAFVENPVAAEARNLALRLAQQMDKRAPAAAIMAANQLLKLKDLEEVNAEDTEDASGEEDQRDGGVWIDLALDVFEWWLRDALLLSAGGDPDDLVNQDRIAAIEAFAARRSTVELRQCLTALQQARQLLRRNANETLALEVLWLRLARGGRPAGVEK